jgi:hypothetical protein
MRSIRLARLRTEMTLSVMPDNRENRQADALAETSLFERQHDVLNEMAELIKAYNDRLTLERRDFGQHYVEGTFNICVKLRARGWRLLPVDLD